MNRALVLSIVALILVPALHTTATGPNDWPQFRADSSNTGTSNGIAPKAGSVIWTYSLGEYLKASPIVADGKLFIGDMSGMVWALNADTGEFLWNFQTEDAVESTPTFYNGMVLVGSNDKKMYALDAENGTELWAFETDGTVRSSVSLTDPEDTDGETLLVFGSYDNNIYALDPKGNEIWRFAAKSFIHGKPAVDDGLAFTCSCDKTLYGIDIADGGQTWNVSIDDHSGISPSALDGMLYAAGRSGKVFAVNISTNNITWTYDLEALIEASPAVGDGKVFIGDRDGKMVGLDIASGERSWLYRATRQIMSSPALVEGILFFGDSDRVLHALQASNGKELWNFTADGDIDSSPAVAHGKVYFGSSAGTVYALGDTKPSVNIISPTAWEKVKGKVDVEVEAFGIGLTSVEVSLDGKNWEPATYSYEKGSWEGEVDTKKFKNGERELQARATNATGSTVTAIYVIIKNPKVDRPFIPGFGTVIAVAAIVVVALLTIGRRR